MIWHQFRKLYYTETRLVFKLNGSDAVADIYIEIQPVSKRTASCLIMAHVIGHGEYDSYGEHELPEGVDKFDMRIVEHNNLIQKMIADIEKVM